MLQMLSSSTIPALEQSAIFAQRRHAILAGNVANIDTPDYRARDLSKQEFQDALEQSIQRASRPINSRLRPGSPGHASSIQPAFGDGPRKAMEQVVYHDGSDVSLEQQVTEIAKNQSSHNTAIALMRHQFDLLRAAITEKP